MDGQVGDLNRHPDWQVLAQPFLEFIIGLESLGQPIVLQQISSQRIQVIRSGQCDKLHVHLPVQH